ncbi:MAG: flavin reductase family protein [Deltaproteobacteria bacterium]|jgi:flavin reductase (DIM6/NTAB) family NADH-FMN oxidoreductase RutF|nr:flavin reductase family protein [Deltaproteobacteria bacterium]
MKISLGARTLALPMPAFLVGTYDANGRPNVMTAAWGGIVCSEPPLIAVSVRPPRWTHAGVLKNKALTISFPPARLAVETDFAGIVSGKDHDKFKEAGLTAVKSDLVEAPYVGECPVVVECRLHSSHELGTHTLFIGEIVDVKADREVAADGGIDMQKADPLVFGADGNYHKLGPRVARAFSAGKDLRPKS